MPSPPKISDAEWQVMKSIWSGHPASGSEIIERLAREDATWHPKTVRTLLTRLVQKGALSYEADGRSHVYSPVVTEREAVDAASATFLERVFGGTLKPMLAHFVEHQRISEAEIKELRALLDKASAGSPPDRNPAPKHLES